MESLTEQAFLIRETLVSLRGLTDFATGRHPTGAQAPKITVTEVGATSGVTVRVTVESDPPFDLRFTNSIQDPEVYADRAREWLKADARVGLDDGRPPAFAAATLLDPSIEAIHQAAEASSRALLRAPYSPAAHESAAAVLGVVGLREQAAGHTDVRRILTRMTAHLAMARLSRPLAPGASDTTALAAFSHSWLSGRTAEAYALADAFGSSATGRSWRNAGQLLSSEDWRGQTFSGLPTFMERLAYFRAFNSRVATDRIHTFLSSLAEDEAGRADWSRAALTGQVSVQTCHVFGERAPWPEIHEVVRAIALFRGLRLDVETGPDWGRLVRLLTEEESSYSIRSAQNPKALEVLPWPLLAASYQRHIGAALSYELHCARNVLYQPDRVARLLKEQEDSFGTLTLFPLEAQRWANTSEDAARFTAAAADLVNRRPDLVSPHLWMRLLEPPVFRMTTPPLREPYTWFRPVEPLGLALADISRLRGPRGSRHFLRNEWEGIVALDPFDIYARWVLAWGERHKQPAAPELGKALGASLAWSPAYMKIVLTAEGQTPAGRRLWASRRCDIEADFCEEIGEIERKLGHGAEAERAYRRLWKDSVDRVTAANHAGWLVERLQSTGRVREAFEIAERAAAVYSYRGLETLAKLQEETGRLRDSLETWSRLGERYDHREQAQFFLKRQIAAGHVELTPDLARVEAALFPGGRLMAVPSTAPPGAGIMLSNLGVVATQQGFHDRDILVAVNGFAVSSREQFRILLMEAGAPKVPVRLFRGDRYLEIAPTFSERKIEAVLTPYPFKGEG